MTRGVEVPNGRRGAFDPTRDVRNRLSRPKDRLRMITLLALATSLAATSGSYALGSRGAGEPSASAKRLETGKRLYRKYCGQCHALTAARAAGFGSNRGLGKDGGPSFNNLRVPYGLSVLLINQASNGHERLFHKLTWAEIRDVSAFLAAATKDHPLLARPTDG
jgi:mono/diheme cytochrome c family protein